MRHLIRILKSFVPFIKISQFKEIEPSLVYVIKLCTCTLKSSEPVSLKLFFLIQSSLDHLHERLNVGHWKDVSITDRRLITLFSFYKVLVFIELNNSTSQGALISKCFEFLDHGLLFGAPIVVNEDNLLLKCSTLLTSCRDRLQLNNKEQVTPDSSKPLHNKNSFNEIHDIDTPDCLPSGNTVDKCIYNCGERIVLISQPSLESFKSGQFDKKSPAVLTNCIGHWPAMQKWKDIGYLKRKAGHRTVPIELGSKYTDENWTQKLMTVGNFIEASILTEHKNILYLAQHRLFDQIPELMSDLRVPDYCCIREDSTGDDTELNAWFGPMGTISPLHFDPKHNLLAQVVGEKLVILFSPDDSKNLYCHTDNLLLNTAQVDPMQPDLEKFPEFRKAKPYFCVLRPGEMIYIPPKWWHYIKSLSISFSVSFWWM